MKRNWLNISKRAGDQHIGQTLIRMARMAEAIHLHHIAQIPVARCDTLNQQSDSTTAGKDSSNAA